MERQTMNKITRGDVERELRFINGAALKSALFLAVPVLLILVPITIAIIREFWISARDVFSQIGSAVFLGLLLGMPIVLVIFSVVKPLVERVSLRRGAFEVVACEVLEKGERLVHRHTEEFLRFRDFREISVGSTTYQLASRGDIFYVVHYKKEKRIKLLYPAKTYEYRE